MIREQAALLIHTSNLYFHRYQGPLARKLSEVSGLQRSFFSNSGTESMEGAIKMIRSHGRAIDPEKYEIVSLDNSFHGRTFGSLSITGQPKYRKDFEPLLPGVGFVPPNDIAALEQAVTSRTAGIVIEWIQGEGGIFPISDEFAQRARELADRYDALLVFDEIQCGVGRTGQVLRAISLRTRPVMPDIMVAAKPLACGFRWASFAPMSARPRPSARHARLHVRRKRACPAAWRSSSLKFSTNCCRRSGASATTSARGLRDLASRVPFITEVRGHGLMAGVQLSIPGADIVSEAMRNGLADQLHA